MKDHTPQELAAIRQRQQHCPHSFIKGLADKTPICAKCGISNADWEALQTSLAPLPNSWNIHTLGSVP
jgi:hypothetical protein